LITIIISDSITSSVIISGYKMYVCICRGVNEKAIHQAVADGAQSVRDVRRCLDVGSQCGQCVRHAHEVIEQAKSSLIEKPEFYAA